MAHIRKFNENLRGESDLPREISIRLDLNEFQKISQEVGYYEALSNIKHYDENDDEFYDDESISKLEELKEKQNMMFEELIRVYSR